MAKTFKEVGGPTNSGNSGQGGQTYSVASDTETVAEMQAESYLNEFSDKFNARDSVLLAGTDGSVLVHVVSISAAGVVTANRSAAPESIIAAGGIDPLSAVTEITTGAGALPLTLEDGVPGNKKTITMIVDGGGTATITPTTFANGATLAFADVNDTIELLWANTIGWVVVSNSGVTVA